MATTALGRCTTCGHYDCLKHASGERVFTAARQAQGFRSQAHLDAFYRAYDHERSCGECGKPGPAYWSEADASWQPTSAQCPMGRKLDQESFQYL